MPDAPELEERIVELDAALTRDGGSVDQEARVRVAEALVRKARWLLELERVDEALGCFDSVVARFGDDGDGQLRLLFARALGNRGYALLELARYNEADPAPPLLLTLEPRTPRIVTVSEDAARSPHAIGFALLPDDSAGVGRAGAS